ncbi:unnamed protein product [Parascedosporium putredinis]|uniref:Uncharacterized protein n=1 Tax=Parascedosporium putredinis TaxID=1442378 RepID=A0A9P1GZ64_9PEZI|nr:unnamed protein product [Parascedosporium putredinis]CAI7992532.1 unnamed protein product [Parascedosporium putredinis]
MEGPAGTNWKNLAAWTLFPLWFILLILTTGYITTSFSDMSQSLTQEIGCLPDDSFSISQYGYDQWAPTGFFEISIPIVTLASFTNVKVIDVSWDVVVGRGGQALLVFVSWRVFAKYMTTSMARKPATYTTFWVIFMHQEATLFSVCRLLRDFVLYRGPASLLAAAFIFYTATFALIFPTLSSSMTGYKSDTQAFIGDGDGNLLKWADFQRVVYIVHDGERAGLENEQVIHLDRDDVEKYGFEGRYVGSTEFDGKLIEGDALNISGSYIDDTSSDLYAGAWCREDACPYRTSANALFTAKTAQLFRLDDIVGEGSCQPVPDVRLSTQDFEKNFRVAN